MCLCLFAPCSVTLFPSLFSFPFPLSHSFCPSLSPSLVSIFLSVPLSLSLSLSLPPSFPFSLSCLHRSIYDSLLLFVYPFLFQYSVLLSSYFLQHHRVRYAACNALGQLSTDFSPQIQTSHHYKIVPALLSVLDDFANPRVQTHAGAALVNFCEHCTKEILGPHLSSIVTKLGEVFKIRLQEVSHVRHVHVHVQHVS